ncbi:hypothetical protein GYMC10_1659 [Paenibacillus sp. Y412MC10]|nr:hypothetical protein GYMC10_1659 [Paenibacillus sp. Y412MC10]
MGEAVRHCCTHLKARCGAVSFLQSLLSPNFRNDDDSGRNSAPKATASLFRNRFALSAGPRGVQPPPYPLPIGRGRERGGSPLRGCIVPPIAVVAEFPGMMMTAEEIRLQRRPLTLFRNRFALSAGPRGAPPSISSPNWSGKGEMWKPAARPYRSSNRCCRRISWNECYSGRNSAPVNAFDGSFPLENFRASANAFPESIRPLR